MKNCNIKFPTASPGQCLSSVLNFMAQANGTINRPPPPPRQDAGPLQVNSPAMLVLMSQLSVMKHSGY